MALKISVDERTALSLEQLAARLDRPVEDLASDAISTFVAVQSSHLEEIEAGLRDADAGRFTSEEEVGAVLDKYARDAG